MPVCCVSLVIDKRIQDRAPHRGHRCRKQKPASGQGQPTRAPNTHSPGGRVKEPSWLARLLQVTLIALRVTLLLGREVGSVLGSSTEEWMTRRKVIRETEKQQRDHWEDRAQRPLGRPTQAGPVMQDQEGPDWPISTWLAMRGSVTQRAGKPRWGCQVTGVGDGQARSSPALPPDP